MKILIIASKDNCVTQIAKVWLQKFDNDLEVYSAGVYGPGKLDNKAVQALKKYNIDISKSKCSDISLFSTDNWDYVISVDEEISRHDSGVKGYIKCWLQIVLPDPSRQSGPDTLLNSAYERSCFEIRDRVFQFYLNTIHGKEMLGADSCGVECDLN